MADAFDFIDMEPEQVQEVQDGDRTAESDAKDAFDHVQVVE